jgi:hypothetical protein
MEDPEIIKAIEAMKGKKKEVDPMHTKLVIWLAGLVLDALKYAVVVIIKWGCSVAKGLALRERIHRAWWPLHQSNNPAKKQMGEGVQALMHFRHDPNGNPLPDDAQPTPTMVTEAQKAPKDNPVTMP